MALNFPAAPSYGQTHAAPNGITYTWTAPGFWRANVGAGPMGPAGGRAILSADRTYYVRTDGNDANTGLANTAGGAFLTIQKAVDTVAALDLNGYNVTIQLAAGTYTGAVVLKKLTGFGTVTINGNSGSVSSVVVTTTAASAKTFSADGPGIHNWKLTYFRVSATGTAGTSLFATHGAYIEFAGLDFGAATYQMWAEQGGHIFSYATYTISAGASFHALAQSDSEVTVIVAGTITISNAPAFSGAFAGAYHGSTVAMRSMTWSGSATGKRYETANLAIINCAGAGASFLPGNGAGTTANGAILI